MAITKNQQDTLEGYFEVAFSNQGLELAEQLQMDDEVTYEDIVDDALTAQAFPKDANHYNVTHRLNINAGQSIEKWAEDFIDEEGIENNEDFNTLVSQYDVQYFILNHIDRTQTHVEIIDDLEEWIEHHGTEEYLEKRMEQHYDSHEFEEIIAQEDTDKVLDKVRESLKDEGFPDSVEPSDVTYLIDTNSIKITIPFQDLASQHIDDVESNGTVQGYLDNQFYSDIINADKYDFEVEVTSDVEDFEDEL